MKTSEAFRKAKQLLAPNGLNTYICHALAEAAYNKCPTSCDDGWDWHVIYTTRKSGYKTAIKTIRERIGSDMALETWLERQGVNIYRYKARSPDLMQAYRHRWLDALIAEFEGKGD
jgi:hypothetical protein